MSRVLLVDDQQENLEYLSAILRGAGFEVMLARHGEEALAKARSHPPDAVISDLLMPTMDGYTLLSRWRTDAALKRIPFLVYTATYTKSQDKKLALDLGADAFLIKPQEPEIILRRLRKTIDHAALKGNDGISAPPGREISILSRYNDALFRKLEDKTRQLEESNRELLVEIFERGKIAKTQIAILNALPAHIALIDGTGVIINVNQAWRSFAFTNVLAAPDGGIGQNYLSVCDAAVGSRAEGASAVSDGLRAVLNGDAPSFEHEYVCDSPGERRWFRMMATPLQSDPSSGAVVMHIDVSDRKGAEQMLRDSQEQYLLLLNSTAEGIYGLDLDGVCTFCNPAAARFLGFENPEEMLGRRVHEQHHHSRADGTAVPIGDCLLHNVFRSGEAAHGDGEAFFRKDGSQFPVEYWSHPIVKGATVIGAVVTFLDISDRRNLEAQFLQSQKMEAIGRLAGGVAHDFNNALQVVMTCSEMLDDLLVGRPLEREYVKEIQAAGKQGAWLTRHLLAFSRKQFVRAVPLDLNVVVIEIEAMLRRIIGADITLDTNLDPEVCSIEADSGQIEQILMNLVVNARDAMPRGGKLLIGTSIVDLDEKARLSTAIVPGRYVLLSVRDTGCGMDNYTLSKMFEPFFTTKEAGKGTGLGLSTVYGIVKQNGGHIDVTSKPDGGTTFLIYFPATTPRLSNSSEAPQPDRRGGSESILLVEDEDSLLSMVGATLRAHGYNVLEASTGVSGIALGDDPNVPIDLLITDVILPDLSGPQVAERLLEVHPALKVLFISGYTDDHISYPAVGNGKTLLLEKPFSIGSLLTSIREALRAATHQ